MLRGEAGKINCQKEVYCKKKEEKKEERDRIN